MRQWFDDVQSNWWLIVPRILALIYGFIGGAFLLSFILVLVALLAIGKSFLQSYLEIVGFGIAVGTTAVLAFILLSMSKGFWFYEKWTPRSTIFLHGLFLFGQFSELWEQKLNVSSETIGWIVLNLCIILLLRFPPIRRLFH